MSVYLHYLDECTQRVYGLMANDLVTAAMLSFPVMQPRVGEMTLHFTACGPLCSMGDRFSSKLISSWREPPVVYDIHTDELIGKVEFLETDDVGAFMKQRATLEVEVSTKEAGRLVHDQFAHLINEIHVITLP